MFTFSNIQTNPTNTILEIEQVIFIMKRSLSVISALASARQKAGRAAQTSVGAFSQRNERFLDPPVPTVGQGLHQYTAQDHNVTGINR